MKYLGARHTMTIQEIIALTPMPKIFNAYLPTQHEAFDFIDRFPDAINTMSKFKMKDYVYDKCHDMRSRQLSIYFYEEKPFFIYQYVGRGNEENEQIFDACVYSKFIQDYIQESFCNEKETALTIDSPYTIVNYGLGEFFLENNQLIAKYPEGEKSYE